MSRLLYVASIMLAAKASFHQGSPLLRGVGCQCTCNAVTVKAMIHSIAKTPATGTLQGVDMILKNGEDMYSDAKANE